MYIPSCAASAACFASASAAFAAFAASVPFAASAACFASVVSFFLVQLLLEHFHSMLIYPNGMWATLSQCRTCSGVKDLVGCQHSTASCPAGSFLMLSRCEMVRLYVWVFFFKYKKVFFFSN